MIKSTLWPDKEERALVGRFYISGVLSEALNVIVPFEFMYLYLLMKRPEWAVIPLMVEAPHLREFLGFLRSRFYTALATNRTTTTRAVLAYHGLADQFDLVVSAMDVSRPKPHPESLWRILEHFGLTPAEVIYIGDSKVDEEFARNAGVTLVAYRNPRLEADFYLDSFNAGPQLIQEIM